VGRGAVPKAGLAGFSVSNLNIPGLSQPWEMPYGKPKNIASALEIMLEAPIGAAAFNNEFGRPNICGYFRTYEVPMRNSHGAIRGYHKPIMIAGGLGNIRPQLVEKKELPVGTKLIVLGGPAMLIGIGGGAASSMASGAQTETLDFASVQRGNAEMQRRCQEVINACWSMGDENPILSIHDVGAGGLSNALPELLDASEKGGALSLREMPIAESGLSPMEIWCNEAQERYVLGIAAKDLPQFTALAERERCPFAVVGEATEKKDLVLEDDYFENTPVNLPMPVLFGSAPKLVRKVVHDDIEPLPFDIKKIDLMEAAVRILQLPCVADKSFLITIGDRTVTGMIARDPMVGPWQVPVADVAVTANSYNGYMGEAMAMGERAPIALLHHAASARMAVGEAITNIAAAYIENIADIKLSANWMAAAGYPGEDAGLYDAVQAIGLELCPALGISIPVGKDSLSMRTVWEEDGKKKSVTAPMSLVISAFAKVSDIRKTLTPELKLNIGDTDLILIDLGDGNHGLGGSALAQVYQRQGSLPADIDNPTTLKQFFTAIQTLNRDNLIAAYHDRSDGGLFVTLCEMAFAAHVGLSIQLDAVGNHHPVEILFSEELGAVIQVRRVDTPRVMACLRMHDLGQCSDVIGTLNAEDRLNFSYQDKIVLDESRIYFQQKWSETSYRLQALRDNPACADQAFSHIADQEDPGLNVSLTFDLEQNVAAPYIKTNIRPKVAILREQGVNGHVEMAAVFDRAGFTAVDVHMTDILNGRVSLGEFKGLIAGGGFSYGDVLGAGRGWAQSILNHNQARDAFEAFFARPDTFTFGACNGCQMLSQLTAIIPGAEHWPLFLRNQSEQFEARFTLLNIEQTPSIFFQGMAGSRICMAVAHGEGRAAFNPGNTPEQVLKTGLVAARYVNNRGNATEQYPANPNGSPLGIASLTSTDGRATIIMPHPERVFRTVQNSWHPEGWQENAPTMRMFRNARVWVG
jgi:phosphoribosylformylglycinamidine synthase